MAESDHLLIRPGTQLGGLDIQERVGEGAFATVYRAVDRLLGRVVALKILDPVRLSNPAKGRDRILQEARIVARLTGPHVVTLYRVHELPQGLWALEMEYMGGGDLTQRLREDGTLPADEVARVGRAVLSALVSAHEQKIIHYDVKPANVLLSDTDVVKLSDFGLGRFTHEENLASTLDRGARGTPHYMAPEVIMGQEATTASDLWSFGVLLYRILQGRLPFPGRSLEHLFNDILNEAPPPLASDVPAPLVEAALACLRKSPSDRPPSARAVLETLERPAAPHRAPTTVVARPIHEPPRPFVGRREEREVLSQLMQTCHRGEGRAVVVQGEAGIGKTALLGEAVREAERSYGFRVVEALMGPIQGLGRPLIQALRQVAAGESGSHGRAATHVFSSAVHQQLVSLSDHAGDGRALHVDRFLEHALRELTADRPLMLIVEDAHLGGTEDFKLLQYLISRMSDQRLMIAVSLRTRDPSGSDSMESTLASIHGLLAQPGITSIELPPLNTDLTHRAVAARFGLRVIPAEVIARIQDRADGVPLYAIELFRHLLDSGELERRDDVVARTTKWGTTELPRHLREMVEQRLAGLPDSDRNLLEAAAVSGIEFNGQGLAAVVEEKVLDVLRVLQRVYRERGIVLPRERGFRFAHGLFSDALYADLAPDLRRELHVRWAEHLEAQGGADPEILGWHWEQAGHLDRARPHLRRASMFAVERGELQRAWDLVARSGILDPDSSPSQLREDLSYLLSLIPAYTSSEEVDRIEEMYARLARAAEVLGDEAMALRVGVASSWNRYFRIGRHAVDESLLRRAANEAENPGARGDACRLLGRLALETSRLDDARTWLSQALEAMPKAAEWEEGHRARILGDLGDVGMEQGEFEEAHRLQNEAAAIYQAEGADLYAALSRFNALLARAGAGRLEGAAEAMEQQIQVLERGGQTARAAHARVYQGELYMQTASLERAEETLELARTGLESSAYAAGLVPLGEARIRLDLMRGSLAAAAATLDELEERSGGTRPATLTVLRAHLDAACGNAEVPASSLAALLDPEGEPPLPTGLAITLRDLTWIAMLGVDLRPLLPRVQALLPPEAGRPPFLATEAALCLGAMHRAGDHDAPAAWRAARQAAQDGTVASYPHRARVIGRVLGARAAHHDGDTRAAAEQLEAAVREAHEAGEIWLELLAYREMDDATRTKHAYEVDAIAGILRDRNPGDRGLVPRLEERGVIPKPRGG